MAYYGRYGTSRNYFEVHEMGHIRKMRFRRRPMALICARFEDTHTRDQVVEAIDATIRYQDDKAAAKHVNYVMRRQKAGFQLINGRLDPVL